MLTADHEEIYLGTIKFGTTRNFTYTLTNNYAKEVTIEKVAAGCNSCTKTTLDKHVLQAGEQALLSVAFTPGSVGINVKHLTIIYRTGNVQRPNLGLKFKATVNA